MKRMAKAWLMVVLGAAALSVFGPTSVVAQVTTATVTGTVRDAQGGVIPGATVTLISEARGTRTAPVVTDAQGTYQFINVASDTYTVEVVMAGFKTLNRAGIAVSAGDRVAIPALTVEVGGTAETVQVTADASLIQAQSGERSFTVSTEAVQNLPVASRSFVSLANLTPGMNGTARLGGGGSTNVTLDGVGMVDTANYNVTLQMNVEAIAEVKVITAGYQAEFGRASGAQITAVTKSGTNRFHGSLYDVERNSDWNTNSWANQRNGQPKAELKERDWGYSIGGPVGRPGGSNKLFFFLSQEWRPRSAGGEINRFRVPTALERQGDFSQSRDNTGAIYTLIRDASTGLPCTAANTAGCYQTGGVVGRIPQSSLYPVGLNVLNMWPLPNSDEGFAGNNSYNYVNVAPGVTSRVHQEAIRADYQISPALRVSGKIVMENASREPNRAGIRFGQGGSLINGFNDAVDTKPVYWQYSFTGNYTINATTFLEATYGSFQNHVGTPTITPAGNKNNIGLGSFPMLFPDAGIVEPRFSAYDRLQRDNLPLFQDGRSWAPPNFTWGNRIANAPPNVRDWGCCINFNKNRDLAVSLTKVRNRHTIKGGYYLSHSVKAQVGAASAGGPYNGAVNFGNSTNNPLDSTFGFANAALGIFTEFTQASKFIEGLYVFANHEFYLQDNWRASNRLTLDFGLRFVHQKPSYDTYGFASNFAPAAWDPSRAPVLFQPACAGGTATCTGQNLRARNPLTNEVLPAGSSVSIGRIVPGSGLTDNGVFLPGSGPVPSTIHYWPGLVVAPRFGFGYDLRGDQKLVFRGSAGVFYDRPNANTTYGQVTNPPATLVATVNNARLQDLATSTQLVAPARVAAFEIDGAIPTSVQWNGGVQMALPWASVLGVEYVGQHGYNELRATDVNGPAFGAAYRSENQDPTLAPSVTPGASALPVNFYRPYRGLEAVNLQMGVGYTWYNSVQTSFQRRFANGMSFGLHYTLGRAEGLEGTMRTEIVNGLPVLRADNKEANYQLQGGDRTHTVRGNFVWDLPDVAEGGAVRNVLSAALSDWQLSGIVTAGSGAPYSVGFTYQGGIGAVNLTGTPTHNARIIMSGDPGSGCSADFTRQFDTAVFSGPQPNSLGLESGTNYMRGCPDKTMDIALARNVRLGNGRAVQIRVEAFNAFNSVVITGRNTSMQMASLATANTAINLPYDATGNVIGNRNTPQGAGFGVANGAAAMRSVQAQVRFQF